LNKSSGDPNKTGAGYPDLLRDLFRYLSNLEERGAKPNREAQLVGRLAAGQRIPPALAVGFTTGERAALHIIADECRAHGDCAMTIDGFAARAGIARTTVKNVLRKAREDGLITLERHWRAWTDGFAEAGAGVGRDALGRPGWGLSL
jgi:hypothetical protein